MKKITFVCASIKTTVGGVRRSDDKYKVTISGSHYPARGLFETTKNDQNFTQEKVVIYWQWIHHYPSLHNRYTIVNIHEQLANEYTKFTFRGFKHFLSTLSGPHPTLATQGLGRNLC